MVEAGQGSQVLVIDTEARDALVAMRQESLAIIQEKKRAMLPVTIEV